MKYVSLMILLGSFLYAQENPKAVVIGFDGADHRIVEQMMAEGELPNLEKLKNRGGFSSLLPTNPPQTPVSWSTFSTGINPGRTGIFDFLRRKDNTYLPDLALKDETKEPVFLAENNTIVFPLVTFLLLFLVFMLIFRKAASLVRFGVPLAVAGAAAWAVFFVFSNWIPTHVPGVGIVRQGKPIWKILEENNQSATVIRLPITFPAEPLNGEMISGLVVPDMKGTVGRPSIYTNDKEWDAGFNKFSARVVSLTGQGPFETDVFGPPNKLFYNAEDEVQARRNGVPYDIPKEFSIPLSIEMKGDQVIPTIHDKSYPLKAGEWTDWIEFVYKVNPIVSLKGFARFFLERTDGSIFKLYMTPIHPHPDTPLPMSYPPDLAKKVWEREPYKTMGWALDTWTTGDGQMNEDLLLMDVDHTVTRYEKMMEEFLADNDRDLYIQVFSFTDRVGHVLWRYWDEGHPRFDAEKADKYQEAMRETYRRMDRIVGKAIDMVDLDKTLFLVCSDHGFSSFRHQFNYNTWLVKNGYMKLKRNVLGESMELDDLTNQSTPLDFVDWEETKAYAYGLGMVFINLEGREPEGSVTAEEYEALCLELKEKLEAYVDEKTGVKPVTKVYLRDDIYHGYDPEKTPDLRVSTAINVRVSWDTTLGGMPEEIVEINPRNWSGDHCSLDPEDVKGILFSSIPIQADQPKMADMTPSILNWLKTPHDIQMDGDIIFGK